MVNYTIFKTSGRNSWQVQFKDSSTGKFRSALSVTALSKKLGDPPYKGSINKAMAYNIVERAYQAGLCNIRKSDDQYLVDYVINFWDFDNSKYIKLKNLSKAGSINRDYAENMQNSFKNHIMDKLPENIRVSELNSKVILNIQDELRLDPKKYSNSTLNTIMKSLQVPITEAIRYEMIPRNPFVSYKPLPVDTASSRGIPTRKEVEKLMDYLASRKDESYMDWMIFLAVSLAVYTGMRNGEIRALRADCIGVVDTDEGKQTVIRVKEAVAKKAGFKCPKGRIARSVPIPRWLCAELLDLARENPYGEDIIFWSSRVSGVPIVCNCITENYYKAWNAVGMSEEERKERHIDFHSLRHFYNTNMRGKIDDNVLRDIVGHKSEAMTNRYTHETSDTIAQAGKASSNIIHFDFQKRVSV